MWADVGHQHQCSRRLLISTAEPARPRTSTEILTLIGFCAFLFFFGLASFGLVGADEPRYAQIAREMLGRHDWITPVLNGKPWLEKPVFYYWSAMVSYSLFGVSDWAARLPSPVLASALVGAVWGFMRRFCPGAQLDAALITASCAATIGFGRGASTDMPLSALLTMGMLTWWTWWRTERKAWLAVFYLLIGLATLAKGPVAPVLTGAVILVYALTKRDARTISRTLWWPGIALYLATALPWYIAVQARVPEFVRVFVLEHNLGRYASNMFQHRQPFWYYGPVLLLSVLPWVVFIAVAVVQAIRGCWRRVQAGQPTDCDLRVFLLVWAAVPVVFFTFSGSKLPAYILPSVAPLGMLVADFVRKRIETGGRASLVLVGLHGAVAALVLGFVLLFPYRLLHSPVTLEAKAVAAIAMVLILAGITATVWAQGLCWLRFVTLVPVIVGVAFIVRISAPAIEATQSARPVARDISGIVTQKSELAGFRIKRETEYGLTFYRNQPVRRYERGEIPPEDHLVVAGQGSRGELERMVAGRRISRIGEFAAQRLEYFWVSRSH